MLQALGSLQSTINAKNSSPIFFTSNSPAPVPMSLSLASSVRCTMVAPHARAMRLLSVLRSRRMAEMPARARKVVAKSDRPFSVMTTSGFRAMISLHTRSIHSSSALSRAAQSSSLVISTLVWLSPFLYSKGQSRSSTRGFSMRRFMRPGATTSLANITPLSTLQSSSVPPGIFSTLAYFLMSISRLPSGSSVTTVFTAWMARSLISVPNRVVNLVPTQLCTIRLIWSSFCTSIGKHSSSTIFLASSSALR
mmetsp:Transcript_17862/g.50310  ORF Transcript_17862/g.50310 Transcript_17862/m.50310 type:complete len:251 (+) Transcript_17862:620-1372(+)